MKTVKKNAAYQAEALKRVVKTVELANKLIEMRLVVFDVPALKVFFNQETISKKARSVRKNFIINIYLAFSVKNKLKTGFSLSFVDMDTNNIYAIYDGKRVNFPKK